MSVTTLCRSKSRRSVGRELKPEPRPARSRRQAAIAQPAVTPVAEARTAIDSGVELDTRLIAAVQGAAGARAHEACSLLQVYQTCVAMCRRAIDRGEQASPRSAEFARLLNIARGRLRTFLFEQRMPQMSRWAGMSA